LPFMPLSQIIFVEEGMNDEKDRFSLARNPRDARRSYIWRILQFRKRK
jgi:hypothetical protein